jgi:glycosyltransferase involved in cell wall biosynthesis
MPAPISVVIPTLNAAATLPASAASLMEGLAEGLIRELVVSDAGSDDETLAIARALGAVVVEGAHGREGQIARGVAAARGDWLLILPADVELEPGWCAAVLRHIGATPDRAGYFRSRASGVAPGLATAWVGIRVRLFGRLSGDEGLLVSRRLLAGAQTGAGDAALARAVRGRLVTLQAGIVTPGWRR